jgi:hypothetical protein
VNGWFTNMWEISAFDAATSTLTFGKGGFQGGRGYTRLLRAHKHTHTHTQAHVRARACTHALRHAHTRRYHVVDGNFSAPIFDCGPIKVENLLAELDAEDEWYCTAHGARGARWS